MDELDHNNNTKKKREKKSEKLKVGSKANDRVEVEEDLKLPQLRYNGTPENNHYDMDKIELMYKMLLRQLSEIERQGVEDIKRQ